MNVDCFEGTVSSKNKLVDQERLRALSVCHNKTECNPLHLRLEDRKRNNRSPSHDISSCKYFQAF